MIADSKVPSAAEFFSVDFTRELAAGETITGASCTISVLEGTDGTPAARLSGSATYSGTVVSQLVQATLDAVYYRLTFGATTSNGQTLSDFVDFWSRQGPAAGPSDYTTVQNVKEFLLIDDTKSDAVLQRLITSVSGAIDAYLSRTIKQATYTETVNGNDGGGRGDTLLILAHRPVISVTSVSVDGVALPASNGITAGWLTYEDLGVQLFGYRFTPGSNNVTVVYAGGFVTTPPAIENVCLQLVAQRYRERSRIGITNESDGRGMNRSYDGDFPPWCEKILNQYADVVPL